MVDLAKLAPVKGAGMAPREVTRKPRDEQPNPFLTEGWLQQSYETGQDYEVTVNGEWSISKVKKGPRKGEEIERLTGEAAEVTKMLREASNKLGIGVTIQYAQATTRTGKDIPGKVVVHYLGKVRKQRRANVDNNGS